MASSQVVIQHLLEEGGAPSTMGDEISAGLRGDPKTLPSKYFYDARGSLLFERITELAEYYPTRTEQALLDRHAGELMRRISPRELVELGSGSAKKTTTLIRAALAHGSLREYVTLEVSEEIARRSARRIADEFPGLAVRAVVADFEHHLGRLPGAEGRLVAFLGSTIGNFEHDDAVAFLCGVAGLLGPDGRFLLGTDRVKDPEVLHAAYNDSEGVTAEFNLNVLNVVNLHLEGDFDPCNFEHVAFWNAERERIEMHLRARRAHTVRLKTIDLEVTFAAGELMRTEISQKYTPGSVTELLTAAGLRLEDWLTDARDWFALSVAARAGT